MFGIIITLLLWGALLKFSHNLVFRDPKYRVSWTEGIKVAGALILVLVVLVVLTIFVEAGIPSLAETWVVVVLFYLALFVSGTAVIRHMMGSLFWKHAAAIMAIATVMYLVVEIVLAVLFSTD